MLYMALLMMHWKRNLVINIGPYRSSPIPHEVPMKRNILLLIVFELFLAIGIVCSGQTNPIDPGTREVKRRVTAAAAIRAVIEAQRDAWNRGDIEGYMAGYERSP